jgi:glycosyltransferase involved in cell wall biosynthesis
VLYSYLPPLTVAVTASILRILRRFPVICDIQDMWPDTLRVTGMLDNRRILSFISFLCRRVYRIVDHIVVLSPGFKRLLVKRGVPDTKIDVIYNWSDSDLLRKNLPSAPKTFTGGGRFRIVFAGNMGKAQALTTVIQAAEILAAGRPDICFDLVGSGVEEETLKHKALEKKLKNINFISRVPLNEVGAILAEADALLVHLKDDPLFAITIPSKTQAYMAIGKPLLMAVRGDAAKLVEQAGCGVLAIPENPQSLAKAAIRLADLSEPERSAMAENSWKYYERELSFSAGAGRFEKLFHGLTQCRA